MTAGEDVFISYSTTDMEIAQFLAEQLHAREVRFWLAPHFIEPGDRFPERIETAIRRASILIALITEHSIRSPWVAQEISIAISAGKMVIPVLFDDVALPEGWGLRMVESQYIRTDRSVGKPLEALAAHVARRLAPEIAEQARVPTGTPRVGTLEPQGVDRSQKLFVGPQQYTREFRSVFFGRQLEMAELIRKLDRTRVVSVVSPSGAGKSSLLAAGLEPALTSAGWQVISGGRVGHPPDPELRIPFSSISNVFTFSAMRAICEATEGIDEVRAGRCADLTLVECLEKYPERARGRRLLILDQFEEIFTQYRHRHEHRADFVHQLVQALEADPNLSVLLAMRQEYVVDLNHLLEKVPKAFQPERFVLRRLSNAMLETVITDIAAPQARFAPKIARRIIQELNTIHVLDENGVVESKSGEYIELVHLQIVCQHLWETLSPGQKVIEQEDLDRAALSSGQHNFEMFVREALHQFYAKTVAAVAGNRGNIEPRVGDDVGLPQADDAVGRFPEELIKVGCRGFVTNEHTRRQIHEEGGYVGRLPNWVVKQLADRYLLRLDTAGSVRYYELSHDLLAPIVATQSDPRSESILYAGELLKKRLDMMKSANRVSFAGWFGEANELLTQCDVFLDAPGYMRPDECELLLRASIRSGTNVDRWARRARLDHPGLYERVVNEAVLSKDETIRVRTVSLLLDSDNPADQTRILRLLRDDDSPRVRHEAARALLSANSKPLFHELAQQYHENPDNANTRRSMALLLALSDEMHASSFHSVYDSMRGPSRRSVRWLAWNLRMREAFVMLPAIIVVTAVFAGGLAAAYKWIPGIFNWALVQASPGAFMGIFHGLIAGTIWGGGISAGVAIHRLVFFRARTRTGVFRPFGALLFGALAGLISSVLVVMVITNTYETTSLRDMGWIGMRFIETTPKLVTDASSPAAGSATQATPELVVRPPTRPSREFYADLFVSTKMGWAHIILGTFLGIGIAATTNSVRASAEWDMFLNGHTGFESSREIGAATWRITQLVSRNLWPTILTQSIGGVLVFLLLRPGPGAIGLNKQPVFGILGDASTQIVGTLGAVVGLGIVTIVIRHGLVIRPRSKAK